MNRTSIEWCDLSANPLKYRRKSDGKVVWACVKTSPGCAHCYAEAIALRFERGKLFNAKNMEELEPFLDEAELRKMLTAKKIQGIPVDGSKCFVGDMTDVFGEWVPDDLLDRLFAVFALRRDVAWQVLTKRADRMAAYLAAPGLHNRLELAADALRPGKGHPSFGGKHMLPDLPLTKVWLGVSVEDQQRADERIPPLLQCPAAVRFLSCEPLLGQVDLFSVGPLRWDVLHGWKPAHEGWPEGANTERIDWVIVGGESGPDARTSDLTQHLSLLQQCQRAGVPAFEKQAGSRPVVPYYCEDEGLREWALNHSRRVVCPVHGEHNHGDRWQPSPGAVIEVRLKDNKGGDLSELPEPLRVRQFPSVKGAAP